MKRLISALLSVIFILNFVCACADKDAQTTKFEYRIDDFKHFSDIFDNNAEENWADKEEYKITIRGLDTPVVFSMSGMKVLTVTAYGKTAEVNIDTFQDSSPADIEAVKDAVIISETLDYSSRSWIITPEKIYAILPDGDISTRIFAREDGTLGYTRYWGEYVTSFEQWDTAPLDLCDSRDQFLSEEGTAEVLDGRLILAPVETVKLWQKYDLDTMFDEAKGNGMYAEYDTVDDLFEANAKSSN